MQQRVSNAIADPVLLEVFWSRLGSTVTEQAANVIRTSFSAIVREAGDVATALFDRQGRMLAHGVTGTPGHLIPMTRTVREFLNDFPAETIQEGDVFITNDPWKTTGHFFDITVANPIFRKGELIGFAASTAHHADIGGLGFGASANDVFEEGFSIPVMKMYNAGKPDETLFRLLRANVREPDAVAGDLNAQFAANEAAGAAMRDLIEEYRIDDLDAVVKEIFDRSEAASRAAIRAVPDGVYTSEAMLDGYDEPIRLKVTLTVKGDEVEANYEGTSLQVRKGINVCLNYTAGYTAFALRCAMGRAIPHNWGSLRPFKVVARPGLIVSCTFPAPVSARHMVGQMIPGLILQTLAQAVPDEVMADGAGSVWGVTFQGQHHTGRTYAGISLIAGGMGARAHKDGLTATQFPTGTRCIPVEILEIEAPLRYLGKELLTDSGGAGTYRGGLGQRVSIEANPEGAPCLISLICDKTKFPAQGVQGGDSGAVGRTLNSAGEYIHPKSRTVVTDSVSFVLETPGGGGFGAPSERPLERVAEDVRLGYVSAKAARDLYGVAIGDDGAVDEAESQKLRRKLRGKTPSKTPSKAAAPAP